MSYLSPSLQYVRDKKHIINLNQFLTNLKEHWGNRLLKSDIKMEIKSKKTEPFVIRMNQGKLIQILDNFMLNSEYWLKEDIRMQRIEKGQAEITIELDNPFVRISDNGRGIDTKIESIIFEPFVTAKGKGQGRGLGLFIVKQLLDSEGCNAGVIPHRNSHDRLYIFQIDFRGVLNG